MRQGAEESPDSLLNTRTAKGEFHVLYPDLVEDEKLFQYFRTYRDKFERKLCILKSILYKYIYFGKYWNCIQLN